MPPIVSTRHSDDLRPHRRSSARSLPKIGGRPDSINRSNASSCPTHDHQFVGFGIRPPAILRLIKQPAAGCEGRGEARLLKVRGRSKLEVDAIALQAIL
jgi:hypothetical protein